MNTMRVRRLMLAVVCLLVFGCMSNALAADSSVTYDSSAKKFIFVPTTDLFQNFKGIMPGDTLTQSITVKNDTANGVKVKIYLRAEPADEKYRAFLSQMKLMVTQEGQSLLFSAPANETGGLSSNVCLGTFYSGANISLTAALKVPIEMGNEFQDGMGVVNWVFSAEELPIESTDPIPKTGDTAEPISYLPLAGVLAGTILLILFVRRHKSLT